MDTQSTTARTVASRDASIEYISDNIFQLTLFPENKAEVFEPGLSKLDQGQEEASLILRNLTSWCPDVAAQFAQRSTTTILKTPFRLVFPSDARGTFDKDLYPRQYFAISYCWHSSDYPNSNYEPHDRWPFSKPFVDAILCEKEHPRIGLWIDQLCIDQEDTLDKQMSVAAMDVIYRSCMRLLVLLEDVKLTEAETYLVENFEISKIQWHKAWLPEPEVRPLYLSLYKKINAARWWDRAWCFHEFNVNEPWSDKRQRYRNHNATFFMNGPGDSIVKMKWVNLHVIMSTAIDLPSHDNDINLNAFKGREIFTGFANQGGPPTATMKSSIMASHNSVARKGCQNLGDRISIMINISGRALAYFGEALNNKDEVLYFSALLALAAGETYPLSMTDPTSIRLMGNKTWLSRSLGTGDAIIPKFPLGSVQGIRQVSTEVIKIDMIFLQRLGIPTDHSFELDAVGQVFPGTIPTTEPAKYAADASKSHLPAAQKDSECDEHRRRFIATCISNGIRFTANLWEQLKRDVVHPNYNQGIFRDLQPNTALYMPAQRFLDQLRRYASPETLESNAFDLDDASIFLTWVTDPRSMYYIGSLSFRLQCTMDGRQALMTITSIKEDWKDAKFEELQAAIPTDLLNASCMTSRVWILQPLEIDEGVVLRWKVVAKALLLGEPNLMEELRLHGNQDDAVVALKADTCVGG
ncbi:hypothetical protein J4E85_000069 [Alternaria conjuncta]|uniref:uncharacterized protein n=1 Tax=Alternaria conjuncta TaxID=181017 RepID=UPI0022205379|nr:uncharacterized protein J4E85_000069 [Alternaria conjuncta]KAI4937634.1 hypothetical protein J4E85_000069 [Alternaria conjuncta]